MMGFNTNLLYYGVWRRFVKMSVMCHVRIGVLVIYRKDI